MKNALETAAGSIEAEDQHAPVYSSDDPALLKTREVSYRTYLGAQKGSVKYHFSWVNLYSFWFSDRIRPWLSTGQENQNKNY